MANKLYKKLKWKLWLLGRFKIPMLGSLRPKLLFIDDEVVYLKIKLKRRSKNHLNSMYFGALAVGADCAAGLHAFYYAEKHQQKISFAFKSMHGQFLKRVETDAIFTFKGGKEIENVVLQSMKSGERYNHSCQIEVFNKQEELVALFTMEASVKALL
ncbi:MAG TPA: DUF4442 domain-containing protein [Crocinitomicaceae bacterium]|nr:DUF4442 domain-containing protein [Crocinitomicaceae bacterium]